MTGEPSLDDALFGQAADDPTRPDPRDSAPYVPRSVVIDPTFDWTGDRAPGTPWGETVIYECHVRGMTMRHPEVPQELRGTYLGLASEPVIDHLRRLGITAVELLPVHQIASEPQLRRHGLSNYFGYSPLGFLAPHLGYATGGQGSRPAGQEAAAGHQVVEFKRMVQGLHRAGLELLIDVVFNHTAEGDPLGPTLSLRGIDNHSYYRLDPHDRSRYLDVTGCGNTLDLSRQPALDLVIDALAYWVDEMHVDGFRFDLAPALVRGDSPDAPGPFLERLREHSSLRRVKLIAEPWDLGRDGYRLGRFPAPWREWNDRYRDAARNFWRAKYSTAEPMRRAFAGSLEIFAPPRDRPSSIDFVTCHDGFTLEDLVSYERKHNQANEEGNRDGRDHNLSRNWGAEGPTDDPDVIAARRRAKRNLLTTLALTCGVPMLSHGDELGRTQCGNNNAYCHDSELTWIDWQLDDEQRSLLDFTRRALALRRSLDPSAEPTAFTSDGVPVNDLARRRLPLFGLWRPGSPGHPGAPYGLLILLNGTARSRFFDLPGQLPDAAGLEAATTGWVLRLASFETERDARERRPIQRQTVRLPAHSAVVLEAGGIDEGR